MAAFTVSLFPRGKAGAEKALGQRWDTTWTEFSAHLRERREGLKDGPCFTCSTFTPEPDGRVHRLKDNLAARTLIALDIETSKRTGEVPPELAAALGAAQSKGWACAGYTSHNHQPGSDIRYRLILPMTAALAHELPAPEVVAQRLGLSGVLDTSKVGAASLFYLPSANPGSLHLHQSLAVDGEPLDAYGLLQAAERLRLARAIEAERIAAAAHEEAAARRAERLAMGFDPDDSLIEKVRAHYDLADVLAAHGYHQAGSKFRHPNSSSGLHGADIKVFGGIERVFSHNATDPLHADNLPDWCATVTALDVVDVVTILDFGGDRRRALRELASKHGLSKTEERKRVAKLLFKLVKRRVPQSVLEQTAYREGGRLGLSKQEVVNVAKWVAQQGAT